MVVITIFSPEISVLRFTISSICARCASVISLCPMTTSTLPSVMLTTASVNPLDSSRSSAAASFSAFSVRAGHIVDCILLLFFGHVFVVDDLKQGFFVFGSYLLSGQFCLGRKAAACSCAGKYCLARRVGHFFGCSVRSGICFARRQGGIAHTIGFACRSFS